ncbi:MAG TPA: hypothetical protein VIM73_06575 [Polyangiaceae bacterium]|jgi:hypothetical protein
MNPVRSGSPHPQWWNESHSSGWERVKEALRRDWEQTKADLGGGGSELHQGIKDTVRQALGKEPIPPRDLPNPASWSPTGGAPARWEDVESAVRYGYGARQQFSDLPEWDEELETRLRMEWEEIAPGRTWHDVRQFVHRGWMGP